MRSVIVCVRCVKDGEIKEEFLTCSMLDLTTNGEDVMEKLYIFLEEERLSWDQVCGVCTDCKTAMLGSQSGFSDIVITKAPHELFEHCITYRQALAGKHSMDRFWKR